MVRKQTNKYNHPDSLSSTLPADNEDAKSDTPGIPPKERVSEMLRTVSDNSEEEEVPESSQRQGSADAMNNASNVMTGAFGPSPDDSWVISSNPRRTEKESPG